LILNFKMKKFARRKCEETGVSMVLVDDLNRQIVLKYDESSGMMSSPSSCCSAVFLYCKSNIFVAPSSRVGPCIPECEACKETKSNCTQQDREAAVHTFRAAFVSISLHILVTCASSQSYTIKPSAISFPSTTVGLASNNTNLILSNTGTTTLTISNIAIDTHAFQLATGWAPLTLDPTQRGSFGINFVPTSAGPFNGHFIITIQGLDPIYVPLSGAGVVTNAAVSINTAALAFSEAVGATSALQTVTATNTGSDPLTVTGITADPPFAASGFTVPATVAPGGSLFSSGFSIGHGSGRTDQHARTRL
jgi:transmembrane protein TMEM131